VRGSGRRVAVTSSRNFTDTSFDTVMAIYRDEDGFIGDLVGCNDDEPDNTGSTVVFDSVVGEEYFVQVGGFNGQTGLLQVVALTTRPGNDERTGAESIGPSTQQVRDNFGALPADPVQDCGGRRYGKSVWFRFDAPDQGTMTFDVQAPFFTVLALFRADGSGPIACGDDFSTPLRARIETGELPAGTYYLEVGAAEDEDDPFASGFNVDEGRFIYEVSFRPDTDYDNDGVPNAQDRCIRTPGSGGVRDCPDPDNDGWADGIDDRCPGLSGRNANLHRGCPDNDGDDVPEGPGGSDACPTLNARQPATRIARRDEQPRDGCPDTLRLHNLVVIKKSVQGKGYGIRLRFFRITGVPPGSRVVATCKAPGRRGCGKPLRVKRAAT
jgi:hypothetical protein